MIRAKPLSIKEASAYIDRLHRHHVHAQGDKFRVGAEVDGVLVGVAQCGRPGCVGCPMSSHKAEELERYPKFKQAYIRAFDRMLKNMEDTPTWETGEDVYQWWIKG